MRWKSPSHSRPSAIEKGITRWGVNFSRLDLKTTEKSSWTPIPRQFPTAALAMTGVLLWDEAPPSPGPNISLIPYAIGGLSSDYEANTPTATPAWTSESTGRWPSVRPSTWI